MIFSISKRFLFWKNKEVRFRNIEKRIDEYIENHDFFSQELSSAVFYLLTGHELIRRGSNIKALSKEFRLLEKHALSYHSHALEKALYLAFTKCKEDEIVAKKDVYENAYSTYGKTLNCPDFWILMLKYSMFEYGCIMKSRGYFDILVKKKAVDFNPKSYDFFRYVVFGHLNLRPLIHERSFLQAARVFLEIDDSPIIEIDKTLHYWLYKTRFLPSNIRIPYAHVYHTAIQSIGKIKALKKVSINWSFGQYSIDEFMKLWTYLDIKCSLHLHYFDPFLSKSYAYPLFYIQSHKNWVEELSQGSKLDILKVKKIINDLTFNPEIKNLGVRIQPFVPFGKNYLALSPILVYVSLIEGNLLELQSKINKSIYDGISQQKENMLLSEIIRFLIKRTDVHFRKNIIISEGGVTITDIDLAVVEKQTRSLVLIQAKWPLRPRYIFDLFKKNDEIEKSFAQAEKSLNYVKNNLKSFLGNHFKMVKDIQNIYSIIVARDNIGTNLNITRDFPIVDYEIFKMYLEKRGFSIKNICELLYSYDWLPVRDVDFNVVFPKIEIIGYKFKIPVFNIIKTENNQQKKGEFRNYIQSLELHEDYSVKPDEVKLFPAKRIAEAVVLFRKGVINYRYSNYIMALEAFETSLKKYPMVETLANLGVLHLSLGNFKSSEKYFLEALAHKPVNQNIYPNIFRNLSSLYCLMGDREKIDERKFIFYEKVLENIKKAQQHDLFDHYLLCLAGYVCDRKGEKTKAIYYYEKTTKINPDYCEPYKKLLPIYFEKRLFHKSLCVMEQIARLEPDFPKIQYLLSGLYVRLGVFNEKALATTLRALELENFESEEIYTYLLQILAALGRPFQAEYVKRLREFINRYSTSVNYEWAKNQLKRFES